MRHDNEALSTYLWTKQAIDAKASKKMCWSPYCGLARHKLRGMTTYDSCGSSNTQSSHLVLLTYLTYCHFNQYQPSKYFALTLKGSSNVGEIELLWHHWFVASLRTLGDSTWSAEHKLSVHRSCCSLGAGCWGCRNIILLYIRFGLHSFHVTAIMKGDVFSRRLNLATVMSACAAICHGHNIRAESVCMTFDNTRFPFVAVWVEYAHWVLRAWDGKLLGCFVVL